ncbi:MAG: Cgl0159 family (beta/alpha)8-fold protein [Nocardioidaceae bacterium]
MTEDALASLLDVRVRSPHRIAEAAAARTRPADLTGQTGRLLLVAADHPARGAMRAGDRPMAMADRMDMLRRLVIALGRPGVDGVLGDDGATAVVVPPVEIEVVNGLGAGDAFGGALCHGLLAGWDIERTLRFGNAAGAIVASRLACADAMPTADEVEALLEARP